MPGQTCSAKDLPGAEDAPWPMIRSRRPRRIRGKIVAKRAQDAALPGKAMQEHERRTGAIVLDAEINAVGANDAHLKPQPGRLAAAPRSRLSRPTDAASHSGCDRSISSMTDRPWPPMARQSSRRKANQSPGRACDAPKSRAAAATSSPVGVPKSASNVVSSSCSA